MNSIMNKSWIKYFLDVLSSKRIDPINYFFFVLLVCFAMSLPDPFPAPVSDWKEGGFLSFFFCWVWREQDDSTIGCFVVIKYLLVLFFLFFFFFFFLFFSHPFFFVILSFSLFYLFVFFVFNINLELNEKKSKKKGEGKKEE